jgi:3'-phosphoadenosine 5'-phosphosulfate (PAPS) 3'-phosphatase
MREREDLVEALVVVARAAGAEILRLVAAGYEVETKSDLSPVTLCDRAAEVIILAALAKAAPGVPIIAEEEVAAGRIPAHGDTYFLVDPLDGTKEFVRGGDDYTVNIGLIDGGVPVLGVVYQPAIDRLWAGITWQGAFVEDEAGRRPIATAPRSPPSRISTRRRPTISTRSCPAVTMSRSVRASNSASSPRGLPTSIPGSARPVSGTLRLATRSSSLPAGGWTAPTAGRCTMARPPS